jgi:hypothetical protein
MKKILSVLRGKKQLGFILLTLLLALLFVSLLTVKVRREDVVWQKSIDRETICAGNQLRYDITQNENGDLVYTPAGDDPQFFVLPGGEDFNKVTLCFAQPLPEATRVQIYYSDASGLLVEDESLFKPGVLVVPVHTRGFQNCDTTFDKVFADDTDHVKGFKYFSEFREFHQLEEVLKGDVTGRANDSERILSYNIGLGLHDVLYASRIYDKLR